MTMSNRAQNVLLIRRSRELETEQFLMVQRDTAERLGACLAPWYRRLTSIPNTPHRGGIDLQLRGCSSMQFEAFDNELHLLYIAKYVSTQWRYSLKR